MWRVFFPVTANLTLVFLSYFQRHESWFINMQFNNSVETSYRNAESFGKANFEFYLI